MCLYIYRLENEHLRARVKDLEYQSLKAPKVDAFLSTPSSTKQVVSLVQ